MSTIENKHALLRSGKFEALSKLDKADFKDWEIGEDYYGEYCRKYITMNETIFDAPDIVCAMINVKTQEEMDLLRRLVSPERMVSDLLSEKNNYDYDHNYNDEQYGKHIISLFDKFGFDLKSEWAVEPFKSEGETPRSERLIDYLFNVGNTDITGSLLDLHPDLTLKILENRCKYDIPPDMKTALLNRWNMLQHVYNLAVWEIYFDNDPERTFIYAKHRIVHLHGYICLTREDGHNTSILLDWLLEKFGKRLITPDIITNALDTYKKYIERIKNLDNKLIRLALEDEETKAIVERSRHQ